jgi:hypothetical protein
MRSVALLVGIAAGLIIGLIRISTTGGVPPATLLAIGLAVVLTIGLAIRRRNSASGALGGVDDDIRSRGLIGRATVITARPTGRVDGDRHEFDLHLEVQLPRRRRFETDVRSLVPDSFADRLRPGVLIAVAADPAEPGHVVPAFDIDELVSIAGLGPFAGGPGGPLNPPSPPGPEDDR